MSEFSRAQQEADITTASLADIEKTATMVFTKDTEDHLQRLALSFESNLRPKVTKFLAKATEPDETKRLYSETMVMKVLGQAVSVKFSS
jgi:hypothetical protein